MNKVASDLFDLLGEIEKTAEDEYNRLISNPELYFESTNLPRLIQEHLYFLHSY